MYTDSKSISYKEHIMLINNLPLRKGKKKSKHISQNMLVMHVDQSPHFTSIKTNQLSTKKPFVSKVV